MVQLLQESRLDVATTEAGVIDCTRKGGISLAKQVMCGRAAIVIIYYNLIFRMEHFAIIQLYYYVGEGAGDGDDEGMHGARQ